jgi:hypothetical protein
MNRFGGDSTTSVSVATANAVRNDFGELIAIFDQRLASLADSENVERSHILEARTVAERGLKLSEELIERLRAPASRL